MKTIVSRLGTLGFGLALAFSANSSPAEASSITIQNVTLTQAVGTDTRTWCMIGCIANFGAGNLWAAFANTVINSPSTGGTQSLVLTQNPTTDVPGFNFDTSEHIFGDGTASDSCGRVGGTAPSCVMTLNILTNLLGLVSVPLPANNALNNFNADPGGNHNEAANWNLSVLNQPGGLHVWIGYADDAHVDVDGCADKTGTIAGNCLPDNPWQGSPNTVFAGASIPNTDSLIGCLRPGITSCFDAGAIRIELNDPTTTAVPEPASMMLLATGLAGLMAERRRRARKER